jgi:hypothetical protein
MLAAIAGDGVRTILVPGAMGAQDFGVYVDSRRGNTGTARRPGSGDIRCSPRLL